MNTWTDSGMSEAGLVGAMLALGLDTAPTRDANPARNTGPQAATRVPEDVTVRSVASAGSVGRGRFPAPDRSAPRHPASFPPPPMPEPKLASDDLSGWTDGFLAGGSPLSAPASWDEPSSPSAPDDRSAPQSAELTSMLDRLLDPGRAPGPGTPAAPAPVAPAPVVPARLDSRPPRLDPRRADRPSGPSVPSVPSVPSGPEPSSQVRAPEVPSGGPAIGPAGTASRPAGSRSAGSGPAGSRSAGPGSGALDSPLDGPLDVAELEPAQLDFELAPLDPNALEPTLLEPTLLEPTQLEPTQLEPTSPAEGRPAEEPSLAELTGLDRPGLGPVVLGSLGLESMDLDASSFAASPEFPPPTEPAAAAVPETDPTSGPASRSEPVQPTEAGSELPGASGGAHRRTDAAAEPRRAGGAHHRRNDEMSPLSSLDDSPLYSTLSPRQD